VSRNNSIVPEPGKTIATGRVKTRNRQPTRLHWHYPRRSSCAPLPHLEGEDDKHPRRIIPA